MMWLSRSPSNTRFLGPTRIYPQMASQSVQLFLQSSPACPTYRHRNTRYIQHVQQQVASTHCILVTCVCNAAQKWCHLLFAVTASNVYSMMTVSSKFLTSSYITPCNMLLHYLENSLTSLRVTVATGPLSLPP